jgi:ElaB/YqjD/DUF883 family membrane-anchored ribosome-binding protein
MEKRELMAEENYMNQGPAVSPQGEQTRRQQTGSASSGPGERIQSSGTSKRTKTVRRAGDESGRVWDEATSGIRTLKENTDLYVRENPAKAVFTALAIGFVLGLMRRH